MFHLLRNFLEMGNVEQISRSSVTTLQKMRKKIKFWVVKTNLYEYISSIIKIQMTIMIQLFSDFCIIQTMSSKWLAVWYGYNY